MNYLIKSTVISLFLLTLVFCKNDDTPVSSTVSNAAGSAEISIQVVGQGVGEARLIASYGEQNYKIDTTLIDAQGKFEFRKSGGYPKGAYYVMLPTRSYFQIILDEDQKFSLKTNASDPTMTMEVSGSKDNELLYESLKHERSLQPQFNELVQKLTGLTPTSPEYTALKLREKELVEIRKAHLQELYKKSPNSLFTSFKKAGQNPDLKEVYKPDGTLDFENQVVFYRKEFWDDVDFTDERLIRTPVIFNKLKRYINELTVQSPDSIKVSTKELMDKVPENSEYFKFFTNWIALNYEPTKTTLMDSEAIYVFMVQNYINHDKAFWADSAQVFGLQQRAHEMAASLVGLKAPNVTANDPNGRSQSIYEIKSPYVIVYLYNPTCEHCIEETPKLVNFYRQWKPRGLEV